MIKKFIFKTLKPILSFISPIGLPSRKFDGNDFDAVIGAIRVGDILLTKTNYELTNVFNPIPLAHAAMVIEIKQKLVVIEALGEGVVLTNLFDFFKKKDLVNVYRYKHLGTVHPVDVTRAALRYKGAAYDYSFKLEAKKESRNVKLYCYELVIRVLQDVCPEHEFITSTMFEYIPFLKHSYYSHDTIIKDARFKLIYSSGD